MGRHVVRALDRVRPVARVLGHGRVEVRLEVVAHVRRGVLVQRQRRRRVADEDVQQPDPQPLELGQRLEHVARDQVEAARPRPQGDLPLDPHAGLRYSSDAHVHALAAERHALGLEQRALAGALGQRPVGAHDPPPRHVLVASGRRARCRRTAARPATRRRRRARSPPACRGSARAPTRSYRAARCATGRIQSSRSTPRPASSASPCSRTGSPSARCARGRAPGSARWRRSRSSSPRTARTRSTASPRTSARNRRSASCWRPTRSRTVRQVAVLDVRGGLGDAHGPGLHPPRRPRDRRALELPGQHDGPRHRAGRDVRRVRERAGRAAPIGCSPPSTPPRARAATCAGASRRRWSSCPPRASRGGGPSTCASRITPTPLDELRRLLTLQRAYDLAGAATS